jgi:hypothetical protein
VVALVWLTGGLREWACSVVAMLFGAETPVGPDSLCITAQLGNPAKARVCLQAGCHSLVVPQGGGHASAHHVLWVVQWASSLLEAWLGSVRLSMCTWVYPR